MATSNNTSPETSSKTNLGKRESPSKKDGDPPSTTNTPKKAKSHPRRLMDILQTTGPGHVQIKTLKAYKQNHIEMKTLRATLAAISPLMENHDLVTKSRRRFTLVDCTGMISGVCHIRPFTAEVGDILTMNNFKIENGRMTMHSTTTVGRGANATMDTASLERAKQLLLQPVTDYTPVRQLIEDDTLLSRKTVSCIGEITRVTEMREVSSKTFGAKNGKSLRKEIDVEDLDTNQKIQVTLWDESALHDVKVGYKIRVHDSPIYKNDKLGNKYICVYNSDNIILSTPEPIKENVQIVGVEHSSRPQFLRIMVDNGEKSRKVEVERKILLETLPEKYQRMQPNDLRKLCPMLARAYIFAEDVQRIVIHQTSDCMQEVVDFSAMFEAMQAQDKEDEEILKALEEEFPDPDEVPPEDEIPNF